MSTPESSGRLMIFRRPFEVIPREDGKRGSAA
jgi:hypothetical protein